MRLRVLFVGVFVACAFATGSASAAACTLGTTDGNPTNQPVAPRLGVRLSATRWDGRIPMGFNDASFYNASPSLNVPDSEFFPLEAEAGATLSRAPLSWHAVEMQKGSYNWTEPDGWYCSALAAGIRPVMSIGDTIPGWASEHRIPGLPLRRCADTAPCSGPPDADAVTAFENFLEAAAIRYPLTAGFGAWNEPNLSYGWKDSSVGDTFTSSSSAQIAAQYVSRLLQPIYRGLKNGNPNAVVIGGDLSGNLGDFNPPPTNPSGLAGKYSRDFLSAMYAAGAAAYMDAVGFHVYPQYPVGVDPAHDDPRSIFQRVVDDVRSVVSQNGESGTRHLWITETGTLMQASGSSYVFSEPERETTSLNVYNRLAGYPEVDAVIYHTLFPSDSYRFVDPKSSGSWQMRGVYCSVANEFGTVLDCANPNLRTDLPAPRPHLVTQPVVAGAAATFDGGASVPGWGASGITSFTWDFGDGTAPVSTSSPTVSHTYAARGTFLVIFTVNDSNGGQASSKLTVTVTP